MPGFGKKPKPPLPRVPAVHAATETSMSRHTPLPSLAPASLDAPVGIVGAGPAGLTTAILLRQLGIDVKVFERRDGPCLYPQAHVVNTRTCEILREMNVFDTVAAAAAPEDRLNYVTWSPTLRGPRFGKLEYRNGLDRRAYPRPISAARTLNLAQDRFERLLGARFAALGGEILFGHEVVGAARDGDAATLTVRTSGKDERVERFRYVLACDGAGSLVRRQLGIPMAGPPSMARFAHAYFHADLSTHLGEDSGPVHFIAGPEVRGAFVGFDMERTWAFLCMMPEGATEKDYQDEVMLALIRRALGDPQAEIDLIMVNGWNMSAQVAEEFQRGPFFLVGDAAHRFPPTGGLGLNTGVQDAHNIAWKLAAVLQGRAGPALLDSYTAERRPVACQNRDQSVSNAVKMAEVDEAIGAQTLAPVDPAVVRRPAAAIVRDLHDGSPQSQARLVRIHEAIARQRPHFESLKMELGYAYDASTQPDEDRRYRPKIALGGLLPHFEVQTAEGPRACVDLLSATAFTLFVPPDAAPTWESMLGVLADAIAGHTGRMPLQLQPLAAQDDVFGALGTGGGALLVRPDGHIAWQAAQGPDGTTAAALASALRDATGGAGIVVHRAAVE